MKMRAAVVEAFGPPENLLIREIPRPQIDADEVLVRVIYAGVQPADIAARSGWTPPGADLTLPQVVGNEFSGVVEEIGRDVNDLAVGDAVLGFRVLECYAEYVAVNKRQVVHKPVEIPWEVAGALSASGQTAHTALEVLSVSANDVVVVFGAAGGVGTVFTQLAVRAGATVIGTASAANQEYVRSLGAIPIIYGEGQADRIRDAVERIDVAFDAAGRENLRTALDLVADRDRIGTIVDMQLAEELGVRTLRSQRSAERLAELVGLVANGELNIHIRKIYALDEAANAHRDVETGHGRGKVVLKIAETSQGFERT